MAKITVELNGQQIALIEAQAKKDGHTSRCAVIRKAVICFLANSSQNIEIEYPDCSEKKTIVALEFPDDIVNQIDARAQQDGHKNRSAVIRKAISYFFAH